MKNVLLPTEEKFIELIEEYKYDEAAQMYYNWAYKHQDSFNKILNEKNVKDRVINLLYVLYGNDHVDQI